MAPPVLLGRGANALHVTYCLGVHIGMGSGSGFGHFLKEAQRSFFGASEVWLSSVGLALARSLPCCVPSSEPLMPYAQPP
eukprot:1157445-Pelagomonas_calceolata.AAC.9